LIEKNVISFLDPVGTIKCICSAVQLKEIQSVEKGHTRIPMELVKDILIEIINIHIFGAHESSSQTLIRIVEDVDWV
jgi:hypothetical protein